MLSYAACSWHRAICDAVPHLCLLEKAAAATLLHQNLHSLTGVGCRPSALMLTALRVLARPHCPTASNDVMSALAASRHCRTPLGVAGCRGVVRPGRSVHSLLSCCTLLLAVAVVLVGWSGQSCTCTCCSNDVPPRWCCVQVAKCDVCLVSMNACTFLRASHMSCLLLQALFQPP